MTAPAAGIHAVDGAPPDPPYEAPHVTRHGRVADLAGAKEVGAADGSSFLGIDIGDVFS